MPFECDQFEKSCEILKFHYDNFGGKFVKIPTHHFLFSFWLLHTYYSATDTPHTFNHLYIVLLAFLLLSLLLNIYTRKAISPPPI